ncbi:hypothetical protein Tco_0694453 [Tanacetum coccineum]
MPDQSDPLGYLQEELRTLNTKVDQLESGISKKVADDIQSSIPLIVVDALKANLPSLLSEALKNTLPQLIPDSIKQSVLESIKEKLPLFAAQVQETLKDQLPSILLKPIYKEFNAFNTMERDTTMTIVQGEQPPAQVVSNVEQAPHVNEENALVLHASVEKSSEEDTSKKKVTDDEPPFKKLNFSIPSPTPLKLIMPKEPTPPRDPTPLRDESKGKGIATEYLLKDIMSFMEEDVMAQLKEMKILADLKAEKEKSEKSWKKILNPATIKAQTQKMAEHEAKRKKMFDEYNHQITHRVY